VRSRSMPIVLVLTCAAMVLACGEQPRPNLTALRQLPGDALSVTVVDGTGWVRELAIEDPSEPFRFQFQVENPDGREDVLVVHWIGAKCPDPPVEAIITLAPRADGVSLTVLEPWTLQGCHNAMGVSRQVELHLERSLPAARIDAEQQIDSPEDD
jgi:hypothetical protein